ncbi:hypothetical protein AVEN_90582-1 [Araneus ventricosus]|uniref:Uncharacterized protein n=1 Tax=Araneus ventricosus TaxID=182803 RepID=A0A4Y1ZMJ8_ARAVE|nr:hypothetical protein AVEN_90582-1 [Araneus ventricosus]
MRINKWMHETASRKSREALASGFGEDLRFVTKVRHERILSILSYNLGGRETIKYGPTILHHSKRGWQSSLGGGSRVGPCSFCLSLTLSSQVSPVTGAHKETWSNGVLRETEFLCRPPWNPTRLHRSSPQSPFRKDWRVILETRATRDRSTDVRAGFCWNDHTFLVKIPTLRLAGRTQGHQHLFQTTDAPVLFYKLNATWDRPTRAFASRQMVSQAGPVCVARDQ